MIRFLVSAVVLAAACTALPQVPPPPPPPGPPGPPPPPGPPGPPPPPGPAGPPPPPPPAPPAGAPAPGQGSSQQDVSITSSSAVINPDGSFNYSYELSNGIKAEQSGYLKDNSSSGLASRSGAEGGTEGEGSDDEGGVQVVSGSFSYVAPDGQTISVRYTADDTGYHPEGDSIPTPPPAIQRALAHLLSSSPTPDNSSPQPPAPLPTQSPE